MEVIPAEASIATLLREGRLDTSLVYLSDDNLIDRSRGDWRQIGGVRPLLADPVAEGHRYHAKLGLVPVNHCVVVRSELLDRSPWVALNVYSAFVRAKREVVDHTARAVEHWQRIDPAVAAVEQRLRAVDPLPYGVVAQRPMLETLASYLVEQGLTDRKVPVEEVMASSCLEV